MTAFFTYNQYNQIKPYRVMLIIRVNFLYCKFITIQYRGKVYGNIWRASSPLMIVGFHLRLNCLHRVITTTISKTNRFFIIDAIRWMISWIIFLFDIDESNLFLWFFISIHHKPRLSIKKSLLTFSSPFKWIKNNNFKRTI